jgi:hypothetical protein
MQEGFLMETFCVFRLHKSIDLKIFAKIIDSSLSKNDPVRPLVDQVQSKKLH